MRNRLSLFGLLAAGVVLSAFAWGQAHPARHQAANKAPTAPRKAVTPAPSKALSVNDLAATPDAHLGHVGLVGVVATVKQKQGFVLIDSREYKECGLSCLTESGTKKIPVRWSGAAPKVKDTVRVDGTLTKAAKGLTLSAQKVAKG